MENIHLISDKKIIKKYLNLLQNVCANDDLLSQSPTATKNAYDKTQHNKRFIFRTHVNLDDRAYSNKKILL